MFRGARSRAIEDGVDKWVWRAVVVFGDVMVDEGGGGEDVISTDDADFAQSELDGLFMEKEGGNAAAAQPTRLRCCSGGEGMGGQAKVEQPGPKQGWGLAGGERGIMP